MKALDPSKVEEGLSLLSSHRAVAVICQTFWALSDIAFLVFVWPLAAMLAPAGRRLSYAGAMLMSIFCLMDVLVAATLIAVAVHVVHQGIPATHSNGRSMLIFAAAVDNAEGYPGSLGQAIIGLAAWRATWCPKWLAVIAIIIGVVTIPLLPAIASIPSAVTYYLINGLTIVWAGSISFLLWRRGIA